MTTTSPVEHKAVKSLIVKTDGSFEAVVSTPAVDHDGDIILPSAFKDGQEVPLLIAHNWTSLPIGKGTIHTTADDVRMSAELFDTASGLEARRTLQGLGRLAEFSIGFHGIDADWTDMAGRRVRVIKALELFEVSVVLRGASRGTRLLSPVKSDVAAILEAHEKDCTACTLARVNRLLGASK